MNFFWCLYICRNPASTLIVFIIYICMGVDSMYMVRHEAVAMTCGIASCASQVQGHIVVHAYTIEAGKV